MYTKSTSTFLSLLLLSAFSVCVSAGFFDGKHALRARQADSTVTCSEYSTIANLSTIGTNSTYRAAYLQASPEGTDPTTAPLDSSTKQLPSLQFDKELNRECGNLTAVAIEAAESNFTMGIVGQFQIKGAANGGASNAIGLEMVILLVTATMGAAVLL